MTSAMAGIGCAFSARPHPGSNIEDTLFGAAMEGLEGNDFRLLSVLTTWLEAHSAWINADRLTHLAADADSPRVRAYWGAVGRWLAKDRRFARMEKSHIGPALDLLPEGTTFHLARKGEDPRFAGGPLRVPAGILRDRPGDVATPAALARIHPAYRHRILLGPSYRADMWADLEQNPGLSAAELARRNYGSFATAWQVKRDWKLLHG